MSFVVGTAGHIDHGKSTLVTALTGIDPDRLAEEKRRGMTIDLGFAHMTLPSGREIGIVDVPGHARFMRNMLAGAQGLDAVLLVVAADEGVMPQTREHLEILDLLDVRRGLVVLTKVDLVDSDWLELVQAEVIAALEGMLVAAKAGIDLGVLAQIVPVSAGQSRTFDNIPRSVLTGAFTAGGTLDIVAKDIDLACALAREVGAPVQLGVLASELYKQAQARGWGQVRGQGQGAQTQTGEYGGSQDC